MFLFYTPWKGQKTQGVRALPIFCNPVFFLKNFLKIILKNYKLFFEVEMIINNAHLT